MSNCTFIVRNSEVTKKSNEINMVKRSTLTLFIVVL